MREGNKKEMHYFNNLNISHCISTGHQNTTPGYSIITITRPEPNGTHQPFRPIPYATVIPTTLTPEYPIAGQLIGSTINKLESEGGGLSLVAIIVIAVCVPLLVSIVVMVIGCLICPRTMLMCLLCKCLCCCCPDICPDLCCCCPCC